MNLLLERDKTERLPPVLFHYTGSAALLSILGNNCLWATSALYMNDSTEYSHGMDLIAEGLRERSGAMNEPERTNWSKLQKGVRQILRPCVSCRSAKLAIF
jgi:hypothetical protein